MNALLELFDDSIITTAEQSFYNFRQHQETALTDLVSEVEVT
jgi:hypothetical protein